MEFTFDWAKHMQENVRRFMGEYRDRRCSVLEVGIFEGRSAQVFFDEILTHPESNYTGIDNWWSFVTASHPPQRGEVFDEECQKGWQWTNEVHRRAMRNFEELPAGKWKIIENISHTALWQLNKEKAQFDIVYIDGDHTFGQTFLDSMIAWPLCKDIMFWDDAAPHWEVTVAIHHFLKFIEGQYKILFWPSRHPENFQFGIRKADNVDPEFVAPMEFLMETF